MDKELYYEDVYVGDEMPSLVKEPLNKTQLVRYAGASGDFNPFHFDNEFAREIAGLDGIIAHGMLIMGFTGQAITQWIPRKDLRKFGVRFIGMARLGDKIAINGTVTQKGHEKGENIITVSITATAQDGSVKLNGEFKAAFPNRV